MTTQRPLRFSRGCWSLSISKKPALVYGQTRVPTVSLPLSLEVKLSVPKRILKLASRRNQAKRVARESLRFFKQNKTVHAEVIKRFGSNDLLLRLSRQPVLPAAATITSAKVAKALMRSDCDALFAQLARYVENKTHG